MEINVFANYTTLERSSVQLFVIKELRNFCIFCLILNYLKLLEDNFRPEYFSTSKVKGVLPWSHNAEKCEPRFLNI